MKLFFKILRILLGPFMLLSERLSRPTAIVRSIKDQANLDTASANLALYQFKTCPFCIKVRKEIHRLGLKIELRDTQNSKIHQTTLIEQGGSKKVPCLQIRNSQGKTEWLYESSEIIRYLKTNYS